MRYRVNSLFRIDVGFVVTGNNVFDALEKTNRLLSELPTNLYKTIDYKTTSAMIGSLFCESLASFTRSIVNPIEKGHPDIIPLAGAQASEEELRNYPFGLEVKCTVGNVSKGADLRAGEVRVKSLANITWQAHHREVKALLGLVWDFVDNGSKFHYPAISGVFYSDSLEEDDWGAISGTTGRNTKVTGMKASGKVKMGNGWVALLDDEEYLNKYKRFLDFSLT